MPQDTKKAISASEARTLFADFAAAPALVVAVSGGPDSTALLYLLSRWRAALKNGPALVACTVDHGLRKESASEAKAVARLARKLKVPHRIVRWRGKKPKTGLQDAARQERYGLLAEVARKAKARHVITGHTLDDQAETVLIRLTRGSGLSGLGGMARLSQFPVARAEGLIVARPLLALQKSRLIATLKKAAIGFSDDPSNINPRFTRVRLREASSVLRAEGLSAERLSLLAQRLRRADEALDAMVASALVHTAERLESPRAGVRFAVPKLAALPEEVVLRLVGRVIGSIGYEGPVELGKLEALMESLFGAEGPAMRRTLAGALVTCRDGLLTIEPAPARRGRNAAFRP